MQETKLKESAARPKVFRKTIKDFLQTSTLHGVPNIVRTERIILKLIWTIAFIASACTCSYMVMKTLVTYLEFEVVTKINVANEMPAVFPMVSVCNIHPFNTNHSFEFMRDLFKKYNIENDFDSNVQLSSSHDPLSVRSTHFFYKFLGIANSYSLMDEEKRKQSLSFNQTVITCSFGVNGCYESDFKWIYSRIYGNCHIFNSRRPLNATSYNISSLRKSSKTGKINGLSVGLFVGIPKSSYTFDVNLGAHLFIQNQSVPLSLFFDGLDISTSAETNIHLRRIFTNKLGKPYSNCIDQDDSFDSKFFNLIKSSGFTYRQMDCFDLCFQDYLINECKCYDPGFDNLGYNVTCRNPFQIQCEFAAFDKFTNKESVERCQPLCPLECKSYDFVYTTSFSQFPSHNYAENLLKIQSIRELYDNRTNITIDELKYSLLYFNVFYEDFKITVIDELPKMLIEDLFSNIGGNLGLFLGISFLSFIEIFELGFELLMGCFYKKRKINIVK
jgi:hypothetical protein